MYIILTNKPGLFHVEPMTELQPVETYDYLFCGRLRAHYVIAKLSVETKFHLVDETEPITTNLVSTKFLDKFDSIEAARRELRHLCSFGDMDTQLVCREAAVAEAPAPSRTTVQITFITNSNKVVQAPENSNLLRVSLRDKGGIPFKCGGGICGTCKCRIEQGIGHTDAVKAKERNHLSEAELAEGYRMACQTFVLGDVSVSW